MSVSAKELDEIQSDSDEERVPAAPRGPARGVDERASSSGTGAGGASSSSAPSATQVIAPFEGGQYVRLRNRGRGGYLFANETGRGVSVDHRRGMVNTAWAVQVLRTVPTPHVLLRGAYGRYLSATRTSAQFGHIGGYVAQCIFEFSDDNHIGWLIARGRRGSVVLLHATDGGPTALRANGRYLRWNTGVTTGGVDLSCISSMMEWEVQVIPLTAERPPYQLRPPNAAIRWPEGCGEDVEIIFTYAWFGDNGHIEHEQWMDMQFHGRSLTELGNEMANILGNGVQFENMTLGIQAGELGQPIPLLTDLPLRDDPVIILVFMVDSPDYL
ncbi:hypothetical protein U9M48_010365 [Paspalum notatum var. saurae]|uniref:DUF569 domain-containing protein n=1 Tax=Paspalum notatum var. saurae TaxID=547442 RepID=A0AAQ3WG27_PASNO